MLRLSMIIFIIQELSILFPVSENKSPKITSGHLMGNPDTLEIQRCPGMPRAMPNWTTLASACENSPGERLNRLQALKQLLDCELGFA